MQARVALVVPIALALLLPVGPAAPSLGADERPVAARGATEPGSTAPGALAQAPPQTPQPAKTREQPAPEAAPAAFGPAWRSSSTGRQIPDPTGTRFFRPAVSGGAGVVAR